MSDVTRTEPRTTDRHQAAMLDGLRALGKYVPWCTQAANEIERLQRENDALREDNRIGCHAIAELAELRRTNDDDTRDAARYRWIRERAHADIAACWLVSGKIMIDKGPAGFDAAIDEAMGSGITNCAESPCDRSGG